ncbi:RNA polymerase sigma factor [Saccharothrix yanglingensis]|uniref:RNA polymerase sigma factor 70 region 4 type 2 domain-containing protein n=1 Tax=Saccharothrix yanglingensis TaxID=659496 RepID=A0ABU0WTW6_9PSEU|nr:sigma-70 family RNA polymerase sigma factor [Saccharothrix yanglingensis]MDQ2583282.1 hypothetical protein [Saccharothrix yanglingensis]
MTDTLDHPLTSADLAESAATGERGRRDAEHPRDHRLEADARLVEALRADGVQGSLWDRLVETLAAYGLPVVKAWIHSGRMFAESAHRGRPLEHSWAIDTEAVEDMAADTVVDAIRLFRERIASGHWDSAQGTLLNTYFIGACVLSFPNVFRRHERMHRRTERAVLPSEPSTIEEMLDNLIETRSPEDLVVENVRIEWALKKLSGRAAEILYLSAHEVSHEEIGERLGLTPRAVEGRLRRARSEIRRWLGGTTTKGRSPAVPCTAG